MIKVSDLRSAEQIITALMTNNYIVAAQAIQKKWPYTGTDYYEIRFKEAGQEEPDGC